MLLNIFGRKEKKEQVTKESIIQEILKKFEGGYANHPRDKGCETYSGIARKCWPRWVGWLIIDELKSWKYKLKTRKDWREFTKVLMVDNDLHRLVMEFYIENFWDSIRLDDIPSIKIQHEMFDTGVNCGTGTISKMLQRALNALNRNNDVRLYKDLVVDGALGAKTFNAINKLLPDDEICLLKTLNGEQYIRYSKIIKKDPTQEIFWRSWLRRVSF